MNRFCELIKEEIASLERYGMTDRCLEVLCCKIDWALKVKNYYFWCLKDKVDDREQFIAALKSSDFSHQAPVPEFESSCETEEFFDFLIKVVKAVRTDKEREAERKKLDRMKELKAELAKLEREIYGS